MNATYADALHRLDLADRAMAKAVGSPRTLAPGRSAATSLRALGEQLLDGTDRRVALVWASGLETIVNAQLTHFPETIYWDIDYLAASLLRAASADAVEELEALCEEIAALQAQYGRGSMLAFRYTHDFIYGYDWAKWVRKDPAARADTGPFSAEFVEYVRRRGEELEQLIAEDDEKYPKLPNGQPRNPFGFSREPAHEADLFAALAQRELLPVETWNVDATPRAGRPFAELRVACATEFGLPTRADDG